MIPELYGKVYRSKPETFENGGNVDIDLEFLKPAMKRMQAPEIAQIQVQMAGSLTGDGGSVAHAGEDAYKAISRLKIDDAGGELVNCSGANLRVLEQAERGTRQFDPAAVATDATNTQYKVFWNLDYEPERAKRPADYRIPLIHLTQGGEITLSMANPPDGTFTSTTFRVYVRVVDARVRELKSRLILKERTMTKAEDWYRVGGSCRHLFMSSYLSAAPGYTDLSGFTSYNSDTMNWPANLTEQWLLHEYRRKRPDFATGDEFIAQNAVELLGPERDQKIGGMANLDEFHLNIASVPSSGRIVTQYVEDRHGGLAAEWMGFDSVADLVAAIRQRGKVAAVGHGNRDVNQWDPQLMRRLPIRLARP